ncbi:hypothetical protein BWI97_21255 [Siphonobacter sp. BAB-5405]|nr:hypothetical protein BWI97_21255 [Siphonobacter sp. BAB-5405]
MQDFGLFPIHEVERYTHLLLNKGSVTNNLQNFPNAETFHFPFSVQTFIRRLLLKLFQRQG